MDLPSCILFKDVYLVTLYLSLKSRGVPMDVCKRIADLEYPGNKKDLGVKTIISDRTKRLMAGWISRRKS
jgi:hypothetical protein